MATDPTQSIAAIHHLKQEIARLSERQLEALKTATFVGMTPGEVEEYDVRRIQIAKLIGQVALLEKAQ